MKKNLGRRGFLYSVAGAAGYIGAGGSLAADDRFLEPARLGDLKLYYEVHGEGPAVVFAHGGGGNHLSWWQQVPAFSEHYKCITQIERFF